jgi:cytidylate kinase
MDRIVIAVDGPAGAGKSTISKIVAQRLGLEYIDTGAMYRAITLKVVRNNVDISDAEALRVLMKKTDMTFLMNRLILDGEDVSDVIRMPYVSAKVSEVAAIPFIREQLVEIQRKMASSKNVIMDGRDIGTNVLKDANVKIYLTASVKERASRRYKELVDKGLSVEFENICRDIETRDRIDSSRAANPLCKADDAIEVDTSSKSIEEVVDEILKAAASSRE